MRPPRGHPTPTFELLPGPHTPPAQLACPSRIAPNRLQNRWIHPHLQWIYDTDKIQDLLSRHGRRDEPAFFEPPSCPYYEYDSGSFSPYGDELLPVLQVRVI